MNKDSLAIKVGKRIKELRESKNIKQFELAEYINIEPTNMSKIENGVYLPREDKLRKIASVLQVEIRDLFDVEHIRSREELIFAIEAMLPELDNKELKFFYKSLKFYKEIK